MLNNFIKWLSKNDYSFSVKQNTISYFYNAPDFSYDYVAIDLEDQDINQIKKLRDKMLKYCRRYDLDVFFDGHLDLDIFGYWHYYAAIRTAENAAGAALYDFYAEKAKKDYENIHHNFCVRGINNSFSRLLNTLILNSMNHYGDLYMQAVNG